MSCANNAQSFYFGNNMIILIIKGIIVITSIVNDLIPTLEYTVSPLGGVITRLQDLSCLLNNN